MQFQVLVLISVCKYVHHSPKTHIMPVIKQSDHIDPRLSCYYQYKNKYANQKKFYGVEDNANHCLRLLLPE